MAENIVRVLCVFSRLDRGGGESMCMSLYRKIDRSKVQFDFVKHTQLKGDFEEEILTLGGRIYEAPRYVVYNHVQYEKWWKRHFYEHPEHKIIHGHLFTISPIYFNIAHKDRRITIGHSHAIEYRKVGLRERIKRHIQRHTEEYSDYCFACSQDAGKWLFPHKEFTVLNNAVDTEKFQYDPAVRAEVRKELGLHDCFIVGIVGSLSEVKNPFGTMEIFKAVRSKMPDAKLLWVGGGGLEQAIKDKLKAEELTDAVIMTGVRSDVDRLMQAMDVFILPSISEGLPVVLVEAQAAGLHCFCSEAVTKEADITGLCRFLPLGQPDLWAEQILSADLTRQDTCEAIREAGYDIHTTAQWLQDFYLNLSSKT